MGQATMPDESQEDVSVHGLCKWGTSVLFDMLIINLDAGSYMRQTSEKDLETAHKENRDKYLQPCLDCRRYFNPMVYSADIITGTKAVAAQQRLALLLSNNMKREYSEMCGFVRANMSIVIVISNSLLLQVSREKEVYIHQRPDLVDGAVMGLLSPCRV